MLDDLMAARILDFDIAGAHIRFAFPSAMPAKSIFDLNISKFSIG